MKNKRSKKDIAKILINKEIGSVNEEELMDMIFDEAVALDVDKESDVNKTFGQKMADMLSKIAGSWTFIICFTLFLVIWIILNVYLIKLDPFPFILLNLVLSCIAALQAPVIMMSQNRENERERRRNQNDYKTDLKSELILEVLYEHIEEIQDKQDEILKFLKENSDFKNKK